MNKNGSATGLHVPKLNHLLLPWYLKQQPRRQQHEQHHRYYHRLPIRHAPSPAFPCVLFFPTYGSEQIKNPDAKRLQNEQAETGTRHP
uniref:Uncharacterized protein LOC105139404 n=1 Tax=Rhizophora mucronata TaxID=61149 RepID=A0A2P2N2Q0_RHIMU